MLWGRELRGTLERVPPSPQNFSRCCGCCGGESLSPRCRNTTPPPLRKGLRPRRFNQCRAGSAPGDARGEAPCIRKLRFSPFPGGEGGRGDGEKKKAKGRVCRRQGRQSPHPSPELHPAPAPQGAPPPAGFPPRRFNQCRPGSAPGMQGAPPPLGSRPAGFLQRRLNQCRPGSAPGDARGEAPCIK